VIQTINIDNAMEIPSHLILYLSLVGMQLVQEFYCNYFSPNLPFALFFPPRFLDTFWVHVINILGMLQALGGM
jgi:hypothetical protein